MELSEVGQSSTVVEVEVSDDHNVHEFVDAVLLADVTEVGVLLHIRILHMDSHVKYDGPVLDFADDARATHFLPCP